MRKSFLAALLCLAPAVWSAPAEPAADAKWFAFHKPYWALGIKGGAALPLGELATYNGAGGSFGATLTYQGTREVGTDFFVTYSTQPYKLGGGATPLNNVGLGVRLAYELMRVEALSAWVGAGGGYYMTQRTRQVLKQPVSTPVQYEAQAQDSSGLGLSFSFGASYLMTRALALTLDVSLLNIALAGGTADSIMIGMPSAGLRYDF
jgi:hypothetical protein